MRSNCLQAPSSGDMLEEFDLSHDLAETGEILDPMAVFDKVSHFFEEL